MSNTNKYKYLEKKKKTKPWGLRKISLKIF